MKKTLKKITYKELAERVGNIVLNNTAIEFAYKHGLDVEYENGSLTDYYDGNGNEITEEDFEAAAGVYAEEDEDGIVKYFNEDDEEITEDEYSRLCDAYSSTADIYQYWIISDSGAEYLKENTDEIVIYIDELDIYLWGITHYGTSWDYVECEVWEYDFD